MGKSELQIEWENLADKYFRLIEELANANISDFKRLTKAAQKYIKSINTEPNETSILDQDGNPIK